VALLAVLLEDDRLHQAAVLADAMAADAPELVVLADLGGREVELVVEADRGFVTLPRPERPELGVIGEAAHGVGDDGLGARRPQITVAIDAARVADREENPARPVLDVA